MRQQRLEGKTALISGGARGLGAAQVRGFVAEGANVVFGDIAEETSAALCAELQASYGQCVRFVPLDVTVEDQWREAVARTVEWFGELNVLVNNAGIVLPRQPVEHRSAEEWDLVMNVNAKGPFLGIKHALPVMRTAGGGSIVNISSIAGIAQSQHQESTYAVSKGALRLLTKVVGTQHAHEGIRCNSVHPGPIDGVMLREFMSTQNSSALERRLSRVPMGRVAKAEEIVAGVIFLASDESSYMTASELVMDGGAQAQ